jgi:quinolinate synthase
MTDNDRSLLIDKIINLKKEFGKKLTIPAHHYQNMDIIQLSDFVGDSYRLSVESSRTDAEFIVFCGVRFMAESAKILSKKIQKVLLPNIHAGCPMADMIDFNVAVKALKKISEICGYKIVPVAYMNSYADIKSFCGDNEGAVCTSSNAEKILNHYFNKGYGVFFIPDYHLGKNTANKIGINDGQIARIDKNMKITSNGDFKKIKLFLWDGFCHVHQTFTESDIMNIRNTNPGIKIIVHPECKENIVNLADESGSTEQIFNAIKKSPKGTSWAVGTESHFIERLATEFKDKTIIPLRISPCFNMEKITLDNLFESLSSIKTGNLKHEIFVQERYIDGAKKSLQRMIDIVEN